MFATNRQPITEYSENIQLLHADLLRKYKAYDIFCFCPGRLYNLRVRHSHSDESLERFDWFLIVSEHVNVITLYPNPGNNEGKFEIQWHDPQMFPKIYKHIDGVIKRFGIPKRTKVPSGK